MNALVVMEEEVNILRKKRSTDRPGPFLAKTVRISFTKLTRLNLRDHVLDFITYSAFATDRSLFTTFGRF